MVVVGIRSLSGCILNMLTFVIKLYFVYMHGTRRIQSLLAHVGILNMQTTGPLAPTNRTFRAPNTIVSYFQFRTNKWPSRAARDLKIVFKYILCMVVDDVLLLMLLYNSMFSLDC